MQNINFDQLTEINKQLTEQEQRFNQTGTEYRKMASVWLLATFSALGFIISTKLNIPLPGFWLHALTAYGGICGLMVLWNMDMGVNQRLLDAAFAEGLKLEDANPEFTQVRHNMMKLHGGRGVQPRINWFYGLPCFILLIIACYSVQKSNDFGTLKNILLWLTHFFVYGLFSYYVRKESTSLNIGKINNKLK